MESKPDWMNDPLLLHMEEQKLNFLCDLYNGGKGKSQKEMLPYIMMKMKQAKKENLQFSPSEISLLMNVLKNHSSEVELNQMNQILKKAPVK